MKISQLLSLALAAAGSTAAARILRQRHRWESRHNRVAVCVDFDDAYAAAVRAGLPFDAVLHQIAAHGATHVSLPEVSLGRLLASGEIGAQAPAQPVAEPPPVGHWNYLGGPASRLRFLAAELCARLPYTDARLVGQNCLAFAGDLPTISEIGLGFDAEMAERIKYHGLSVVPRPTSYAWPEDHLIDLTLAQAAVCGSLVAFDTGMIIGHELHLETTLQAMAREGLSYVYFAESRHQKGDWFMAKRLAPRVVVGHRLTPADMVPLDYHAAADGWVRWARERGVRFCYLNFFRSLHAQEPLEGLLYIARVRRALEAAGFAVTAEVNLPAGAPAPDKRSLALASMSAAGAASSAVSTVLRLPEAAALPLTVAAAAGMAALPYLDRPRDHLERAYPPSYAPKLIALAASLAPAAQPGSAGGWAASILLNAAAASTLAAATSGVDYHLRVEEYRGFNLHWALPLAGVIGSLPGRPLRAGAFLTLFLTWAVFTLRGQDPILEFDLAHAEGHTHHLSAASRLMGDARQALGPNPGRKWTGLGAAGTAASVILSGRGQPALAAAAAAAGAAGNVLGLAAWRRPERPLHVTAREALPSLAVGLGLGWVALALSKGE